jgi:hypothetical protein
VAARVAERPHRFVTNSGIFHHLAIFRQRIVHAQADGTSISNLPAALAHPGAVLHRRSTSDACDREGVRVVIGHAGIVAYGRLEDTLKAEFLTKVPQFCHWNVKPHLLQEEEMRSEDTLDDSAAEMRVKQLLGDSAVWKLCRRTMAGIVTVGMRALGEEERINMHEQMCGELATGLAGLEVKCNGVRYEGERRPCIRRFRAVGGRVNRPEVRGDEVRRVVCDIFW